MKLSLRTLLTISVTALVLSGCSGIRKTDSSFTTHAESFRIVGYSIPGDDQARARALVPANANIVSMESTPADWTSVLGVIGNILWIHHSEISGTTEK